eukprot:7051346-Pyramimonas_sp.AAC.1
MTMHNPPPLWQPHGGDVRRAGGPGGGEGVHGQVPAVRSVLLFRQLRVPPEGLPAGCGGVRSAGVSLRLADRRLRADAAGQDRQAQGVPRRRRRARVRTYYYYDH